jgi:hypothetical protein
VCVGLLLAVIAIALTQGGDINGIREGLNQFRTGSSEAVTLIRPYIPGDSVVPGYLNSLVTFVFSVIPIPLVLLGSPQYVLSAAFLAAVWLTLCRSYCVVAPVVGTGSLAATTGSRISIRVAIVVSFAITQSLYVPDYGSLMKHLTPFLPLMIAVVAECDAYEYDRRPRPDYRTDAGLTRGRRNTFARDPDVA